MKLLEIKTYEDDHGYNAIDLYLEDQEQGITAGYVDALGFFITKDREMCLKYEEEINKVLIPLQNSVDPSSLSQIAYQTRKTLEAMIHRQMPDEGKVLFTGTDDYASQDFKQSRDALLEAVPWVWVKFAKAIEEVQVLDVHLKGDKVYITVTYNDDDVSVQCLSDVFDTNSLIVLASRIKEQPIKARIEVNIMMAEYLEAGVIEDEDGAAAYQFSEDSVIGQSIDCMKPTVILDDDGPAFLPENLEFHENIMWMLQVTEKMSNEGIIVGTASRDGKWSASIKGEVRSTTVQNSDSMLSALYKAAELYLK